MEFVYIQVNETKEYVQDSLNTTTVVVLEVLFPYGFIYKMGPPISEKQVKESQPCVASLLSSQARVGACHVRLIKCLLRHYIQEHTSRFIPIYFSLSLFLSHSLLSFLNLFISPISSHIQREKYIYFMLKVDIL